MIEHLQIIFLLIILRLRWVYFHICPWYRMFYADKASKRFYNSWKNTIHEQIDIVFQDDSPWKRFDGKY